MASEIRELISLIREDQTNAERSRNALRVEIENINGRIDDRAEELKRQLNGHAEDEKRRTQDLEDLIRKEVAQQLPKLCQANDLGSALRKVTYDRQKELEREAIRAAVREETGAHKLPPAPFGPLPPPTREQSGAVPKLDSEDIMPTSAQQRWIVRQAKRVWQNKTQTGVAVAAAVGWFGHLWGPLKAAFKAAVAAFLGH